PQPMLRINQPDLVSHLSRPLRSRAAAATGGGPQRRRQDGQGDRGGAEPGGLRRGAGLRVPRQERLATTAALGPGDSEDQWSQREPAPLAGWELFSPGRRSG